MKPTFSRRITTLITLLVIANFSPVFAADKPNILIIWGDDIGVFNVGAYNRGMMAYNTPNIDSIASDGILFTDSYGQNSCTAGRSTFITGQSPFRTGLLKVGLPGAKEGLSVKDLPIMDLTNFLATFTTSMPKMSQKMKITRQIRNSPRNSVPGVSSTHWQTAKSRIPVR